jgi:hypothetical protein
MFSNHLMLKINLKNKKYYLKIFKNKKYFEKQRYHTHKHPNNMQTSSK